jgi:hypothetical protein
MIQSPFYKEIVNVGYIAAVFSMEEMSEEFFLVMMDEDCSFRAYSGL